MTPYERVFAVLNNKPFDRYPIINPTSVAIYDSMKISNSYFPSAHYSINETVELAKISHDLYKFDSIAPYFSIHLEACALGAEVNWNNIYTTPNIDKHMDYNLGKIKLPDNFLDLELIKNFISVIKILKTKYNKRVPIIGKVVGPLSLAFLLFGARNILLDAIVEQDKVVELLEKLSLISLQFAQAQFESGADILTWADHSTCDLISANMYSELVLPIQRKATSILKNYGPTILHTCGNVMDRLDYISQSGFDIFHIESRNDIKYAIEHYDNILFTGGINNPITLSNGSTKDIENEVTFLLDNGMKLISPECAIPCNVTRESLEFLASTVHSRKVK